VAPPKLAVDVGTIALDLGDQPRQRTGIVASGGVLRRAEPAGSRPVSQSARAAPAPHRRWPHDRPGAPRSRRLVAMARWDQRRGRNRARRKGLGGHRGTARGVARSVEGIGRIAQELGLVSCSWGRAGDGNLHASFLVDPRDPDELALANRASDRLFELAIDLGGSITGEHGIGYLKRGQLARQWDVAALELHEQIKRAFDPRGIFNPGKKVARR
jgi:FAD/FMN-containing dehydrogenase